ncbi:TrbI F-type domain-containing protein [Porphyrobacter sp. YT40]|uniref:TrbI F-type domain-containing protein n=1 Tax=Porphyrobacter sp. YT40 TaxID=2547601 RepID=UPI001144BDC0|nr:TrbI F-type domain-containing protein [Porphyrobacter sp. YT40]QDH36396.1 conjugal transfer protein TrbI [Porphyrobacter sp. YT40]
MTDLFENADQVAERSSFKAAIPQQRAKGFAGLSPRELIVLVAAIAMFIWGAWVTKNLVAGDDGRQDLVQLQLQGIIGDYLQAQARSASDEQTAAKETAVFMAALDQTVEGLSKDGKIVVVHEAIIGGDVPDVTESVKAAVYAKVPRPQPAQAVRVQNEMQAFMASNGGGQGDVQR